MRLFTQGLTTAIVGVDVMFISLPTDHPTEVKLGIYVNSFYSINEQTMVSSYN